MKRMPDHDGETYDSTLDKVRLNAQQQRVHQCMRDGAWRTLAEIEQATGDPQASVSARLRDLRKAKFGGHEVQRRRRGAGRAGLWEYRLVVPVPAGQLGLFGGGR
jgi:predicted transcriptional regulator